MLLVFGGENYYAAGGAFDLLGKFSDEADAVSMASDIIGRTAITPAETESEWDAPHEFTIEWSHVLNVESGEIIARHGSACGAGRMSELACANKEGG